MPALGFTGGIATGKTTFARAFLARLPADFFDADLCARRLLENDSPVLRQVQNRFEEAFESGLLNRAKLGAVVFADPEKRELLDAILHPPIRAQWLDQVQRVRESADSTRWFCADIPLLFETSAESYFDQVVVVACAPETQRTRLERNRSIDPVLAGKMIGAQLDLRAKISKADYLIWNDSTLPALEGQVDLLCTWLRQHYG